MIQPGRSYQTSSVSYRYTINGQEKTPEIAPNTTTAEFWQYDARIGRRWNVDPVPKAYESPYAAFGNNPIWLVDQNGADTTVPAPIKTTSIVLDYSYSKLDDGWKETKSGGQSILKKEKTLNKYADTDPLTNTCAIRFSYACNEGGYPIPESVSGIRITKGQEGDNGNYILGSQEVRTYLTKKGAPTIIMEHIKTKEDVDNLIKTIHNTNSDFKGIIVIKAGKTDKDHYNATGHVDLLYKDFMQDISMTARGGDDLGPYLKEKKHIESDLSVYIWQIKD